MIEIIQGLPANVIGVRAKGRVTADDYKHVLIPAVEAALKGRDRIRLYYDCSDFESIASGAMLEDFKIGLRDMPHWERMAVVTDIEWIKLVIGAFAFMIHGDVKIFLPSQVSEARRWISAD